MTGYESAERVKRTEELLDKYRAYLEHTISPTKEYEKELEEYVENARKVLLCTSSNVRDALLKHTEEWGRDDCVLLGGIIDFIDTLNELQGLSNNEKMSGKSKVDVAIIVQDDIHKKMFITHLQYDVERDFNKQTNHDSVGLLELLVTYVKETQHDVIEGGER